MTLAAEPPPASESPVPEQPAPPRDPADYGPRKPLMGPAFWIFILFGLACALGGGAFAIFAPRWFPVAVPIVPVAPPPAAAPTAPPPPVAPTTFVPTEPAPPSAEVAALQNRVAALEAAQSRSAAAAAAALAAAALVDASQSSRPFVSELTAVERLLPPSAETRALHDLAETGAPSRAALVDDFAPAAARAAVAARAPTDGAGLFDQVAYALVSVISIRRVSVTQGDGPDAVLARAEQLVADGDLNGALGALDRLPPRAREAMAAWRGRAERRAAIDRAVASIRAGAMADLSQARL